MPIGQQERPVRKHLKLDLGIIDDMGLRQRPNQRITK